jgi:glycosyltransferase involved in cell wall biosynthesis
MVQGEPLVRAGSEEYPVSERRLKLLYFVDSLGLGGANQTTVTVAREMKRIGHEVWFASESGPLLELLEQSGITHIPVRTAVRHPSAAAVRTISRAIRESGVDLLCPNGFDCTVDGVIAGLITGCHVLPTYGGLTAPPYPHPWLPIVNVFSQELATNLTARFGWEPGLFRNVIARIDGERFHPAVRGEALREELGIAAEHPILLMVCRQDLLKIAGVMTLLEAAPAIHRELPKAKIVLLGDGDRRHEVLSRIARIHGQAGQEFIIAPGSSRRIPEAFAMTDLIIANGARSGLEGMACGKPVISVGPNGYCGLFHSASIEGFRRFNFDKGRLSGNPLGGVDNLTAAAVRILKEEGLRRRLGEFCLEYARKHLIIQSASAEYDALYHEAISGPLRRTRTAIGLCASLLGYYGRRIARRFRPAEEQPAYRLDPPPAGLDPDWRSGMIEACPL